MKARAFTVLWPPQLPSTQKLMLPLCLYSNLWGFLRSEAEELVALLLPDGSSGLLVSLQPSFS